MKKYLKHWSLRFFPSWVSAWTLGEHIYFREDDPSAELIRHESIHVAQYRKHGILKFLALYLWYCIAYGYEDNPFEVEARR